MGGCVYVSKHEAHAQPCGTVRLGHVASTLSLSNGSWERRQTYHFPSKTTEKVSKKHDMGPLPCRTGVTGFRGNCSWVAPDRGRAPPLAYGGMASPSNLSCQQSALELKRGGHSRYASP